MKQNREICVLYVTATCNLQCKYCYIDKSPVLVSIDNMLEQSYQGDYYFNFMQEMFEKDKLNRMEFWGGEPTYGLVRAIPTVKKALNYFPNLNHFFLSTNLSLPSCVSDIINFCQVAKAAPEREITVQLQLSLDGPLHINDFNRGKGVTKAFTENFSRLLFECNKILDEIPNLRLRAGFKPTLDNYAIGLLQTKQSVIDYYQFFDKYYTVAEGAMSRWLSTPKWQLFVSLPNTAAPSPHTTEDGKRFANFCKLCNEINIENKTKNYFQHYSNIMVFYDPDVKPRHCLDCGCGTCGTGNVILGLLPNYHISGCHNGFVELISDYKLHAPEGADFQIDKALFTYNGVSTDMIFTKEEYPHYEKQMSYYCRDSKFQVIELSAMIKQMAAAGQIDKKYADSKMAVEGAHFIQDVTSSCMRDNLGTTGSKYLYQLGFIRLFLNGAKEEIENCGKYLSTAE